MESVKDGLTLTECIDTESYLSWRGFLLSLRPRGLSGVRLVVSDAHEGLVRAVRESLPGAAWQRCIAYLERNVLERCRRKGDGSAAAAALAHLAFPREHRHWVRTNNVQERMNCEIKRRTRVVQVFPSAESLVRLVGAVCCDQNDAWACERNFIGSVPKVGVGLGSSDSLRPPSRTEPYTNFRDTTGL